MNAEPSTHAEKAHPARKGSFFHYLAGAYNRADAYPVGPRPDPILYRPAAKWLGRLILPRPEERSAVLGAWMEVQYAEPALEHLIGQIVRLRWQDTPETNQRFWAATRPVRFSRRANQLLKKGYVLAERVNKWNLVNPFESLIGAYPVDDMIVRLPDPVVIEEKPDDGGSPIFFLSREPIHQCLRWPAGDRASAANSARQTRGLSGSQ